MVLADLVREISGRAHAKAAHAPRHLALRQAAQEVLEPRDHDLAALPRRILAALLGVDSGSGFDATVLEALTPDVVVLLDIVLLSVTREDAAASVH